MAGPIRELASKIELLLMDCDGVLTDGRLYFSPAGEEMKVFHVRDGQGIVLWHKAGFLSGIITGRDSENILKIRADELGMRFLRVRSEEKINDFESILGETGLSAEQTAYIGDDIGDLPLLRLVGLPIAVADAVPDVTLAAEYVTKANGGYGAVREVIDLLLNAKNG
jgi:3-deoxy-D-manno-octulosonate 8-phosphate phosphatase (KDO 8-P phosphatase)